MHRSPVQGIIKGAAGQCSGRGLAGEIGLSAVQCREVQGWGDMVQGLKKHL